jgi:cell division protease FtsH
MFQRNEPPEENRQSPQTSSRAGLGCSSWGIWAGLIVMVAAWTYFLSGGRSDPRTEISYTSFRQQLEQGNIQEVTVQGEQIEGELQQPATVTVGEETQEYTRFVTYLPAFGDEGLFSLLQEQGVEIHTLPQEEFSIWFLLINALPFLLFLVIGFFILRSMRAQGQSVFSFAKSRARLYERTDEGTTFKDVAGARGAKVELQEIIDYLKSPQRFERLGGSIPKGVLLVGPPGTGKTLLARAVAGEANVPFFNITGSDFMEMFVGVGASRVRDLFEEAKKSAPSIIFIDELDSIGRRRGAGLGGGHDEREQTLNQLLSEMDGFQANQNVIVMAATNRPDILDPALLRPGRFDRRITVDLPTMKDREEILKIHARNKPLADDVDLEKIARGTPGFSGADLENLLNEAALLAARKGKQIIDKNDVDAARDKVLLGLERENLILTEEECRLLAYHEAGHAVVAAVVPHADPIHKVTIVPRGRAMGVTQQLPERDRYLYPRDYMLDRLAVIMGGRAAEMLVLDTITSGAENDLKQATRLARKMVLDWGMSDRLGHVALGDENEEIFLGEDIAKRREYSESTAREVDLEIRTILEEAFDRATQVLVENREALNQVAVALLDREDIPGSEVVRIVRGEAEPEVV